MHPAHPRWAVRATVTAAAVLALTVLPATAAPATAAPAVATPAVATVGAGAPQPVCDRARLLTGPSPAPAGAVTVPAGDNSDLQPVPRTTYWFAPGTHTLGDDQFGQIIPADGDVFLGGPGAVIDGRHLNRYAFTQHATDVTVAYLTIQNFGRAGDNGNEGVVNHDAGHGWTVRNNTVQDNAGAGVFVGSGNVLRQNCLRGNGQYGFSAYEPDGVTDVVIDRNEITGNDVDRWETRIDGCGCTGGGKFWETDGATITGNWFRGNFEGPGLWADTDNNDFVVTGNTFTANASSGIIYETSYNAVIRGNTFVRNAIVAGPRNPGFPTGAIYVSESGGDSRVPARTAALAITANSFVDNWAGVVVWENADRFCNSPANTSSGSCTLVDPAHVTTSTCSRGTIDHEPYYSGCRWKSQNVSVRQNSFSLDPAHLPRSCRPANSCGLQGLFANYGTYPSWSPYQGTVVEQAITFAQGNVFARNTYVGPWRVMAYDQGRLLTPAEWQAAPYRQDVASSFG